MGSDMEIDLGAGFLKPKLGTAEPVESDEQSLFTAPLSVAVEFTKLVETPPTEPPAEMAMPPVPEASEDQATVLNAQTPEADPTQLHEQTPTYTAPQPLAQFLPSVAPVVQANLLPNTTKVESPAHILVSAAIGSAPTPATNPETPLAVPDVGVEPVASPPIRAPQVVQSSEQSASEALPPLRPESTSAPAPAKPAIFTSDSDSQTRLPDPRASESLPQVDDTPIPAQPAHLEIKAASVGAPANTAPIITANPAPTNTVSLASALEDPLAEPEMPVSIRIDRTSSDVLPPVQATSRPAPPIAAQISEQIQQQISKNGQQVVELKLDPPELGRVVIQLTTHDQTVSALISSDRPETTELMRRHAELLQSTLEKSGFSQANLSFEQGQQQGNGKNDPPFFQLAPSEEPHSGSPQPKPMPALDGGLDIRL